MPVTPRCFDILLAFNWGRNKTKQIDVHIYSRSNERWSLFWFRLSPFGCVFFMDIHLYATGPLITKRTDVLWHDLVKPRSREIGCIMFVSLWNWAGVLAALLPRCMSNVKEIRNICTRISWSQDFARSYGKTSVPLVNIGPGFFIVCLLQCQRSNHNR